VLLVHECAAEPLQDAAKSVADPATAEAAAIESVDGKIFIFGSKKLFTFLNNISVFTKQLIKYNSSTMHIISYPYSIYLQQSKHITKCISTIA
jgi:hypothetical protein